MARKVHNPNWQALRKLDASLKLALFYIWDKSDDAGVYTFDPEYMTIDTGLNLSFTELTKIPGLERLDNDRLLITDFIRVNFGHLKPDYNPHKPAFRAIEKNQLELNPSLTQACAKLVSVSGSVDGSVKVSAEKGGAGGKLHQDCMAVYSEFIKSKTGVPAKIDVADGKAMKTMIAYFRGAVKGRNEPVEDEDAEVVKCFQYLFANFSKWQPFHQGRIKLSQINSDLQNIIQSIKNPQINGKSNRKSVADITADALYHVAQRNQSGAGN